MFAVMCEFCSLDIQFVMYSYMGMKEEILRKKTVHVKNGQWSQVRLYFRMKKRQEDVYLRITTRSPMEGNNFWAFNELRSCHTDEIRVLTPAYPNLWTQKCQFIRDGTIVDIKSQKEISVLENWKECKEHQFGEDCLPCELVYDGTACRTKNKYCQLIGTESEIEHKCYCSIGNSGKNCQERCSSFAYGHSCQKSCGNCQGTCWKDPLFGKCDTPYCFNNYVGEKCDLQSGIYIFDDLPDIEAGPTSCNLTVKSFNGKGLPSAPPLFYEFQYKEVKEKNWHDVTKEPLKFNVSQKITLRNLKIASNYSIRVFGFNSESDLGSLNLMSNDIPYGNFMTRCIEITENQIAIESDKTSVKFRINVDEVKYLCDLSTYSFTVADKEIIVTSVNKQYTVDKLNPYTDYNLAVERNDERLFMILFQTKESEPEEVQSLSIVKTDTPSVLRLTWLRPTKTNGILLYYNIFFQLKKYQACREVTKTEEFEISVPGSDNKLLQTELKPYAEYNIEIKANTSAGFGPSIGVEVKTDPTESMKQEEIPEVEVKPGIDYVEFKFLVASCDKITGPIYVDTTVTGTPPLCDYTKTANGHELKDGDMVIRDLDPFCNYTALLKIYRKSDKIEKEISTSFTTLEGAPNEITQLTVTSKGSDHISLRWSPPSPPTGELAEYKVSYCYTTYWKNCNENWRSFSTGLNSCKLWPEFHCLNMKALKKNYVYTVKVQSKNKGNPQYSNPIERGKIMTDDQEKSKPPHDLSMSWTEENYLYVTWHHPVSTGGILSSYTIYVNKIRQEYKVKSENDYHLVYNATIKNGLIFPDYYTVKIAACNLAGESQAASISGESPPPFPEESIKKIDAKTEHISISFEAMKLYRNPLRRFMYVLITECAVCQEKIDYYKAVLLTHHKTYNATKQISTIPQRQWKAIKVYNDMEQNYPRKLDIGKNTSNNIYILKPNTNYTLAFIWIYQFGQYVRVNYTINSANIASASSKSVEAFPTGIIITSIVIIAIVLIATVAYIRMKKEIHQKIGDLFMGNQTTRNFESEYENHQIVESTPARADKNVRKSAVLRLMPDTICPGNPLFRTKNSRRIKLEHFPKYVKNVNESNELWRQHELFPRGPTKPWTYGALPENKPKNRYNNLIAYNHSRVVLNKIEGDEHSDYINANYIDGYQSPRAYIATQGPKKHTVHDFWRMIWQEKVTYIVVMANVYEEGKKKTEQYWPNNNEKLIFGDFTIGFLSSEVHANYEYRKFELLYQYAKPRKIGQLHFKAWPDHGVPLYPRSLVPILEKMLTFRSDEFPIVVHCSAGVGRTGTVILCDICLRMAAAEGFVDILAMLEHLRNQRANMVDNVEQYKLAHLVILNCLMGLKTNIPVNQEFARKVEELFEKDVIGSQLEYIRDCEWEDDSMKTVSFIDDEEMPMFPEKDRFPLIIPDKTSRVFLLPHPPTDSTLSSTYINAVQVDGFCQPGRFIVTQYPLPSTVGDFWRLVAEKNISVVVCLNEIPTNDNSCKLFFPIKLDDFSPVDIIRVKNIKNKNFQVYSVLTIQMTVSRPYQETKSTTVEIVKFRGWKISDRVPDFTDFLSFVEDATNIARKSTPALITCYDGATASGLFIAMSFLIEKIKLEQECDVCQAVRSIRISRKQFTNTEEQLKFLYKASVLYVDDKFNQYSNMDLV